ncbi:MAG: response regulator [Deltaproteobacteria bacterium]|nr:response regulator [Deltaproteobacteria bacterium]MBW1919701.1 response regulator [Deltaproteobacteria bacterium]MBW1934413.1 response regulator [Deltaproteobacteria bacterium]MBW1977251.1 response regulator [Deltaproteobacteria bacterium]MBW2044994.1 response regulator [Deltaproteobacteria bacterium]
MIKIMAVDDEEAVLKLFSNFLQREGYQVLTASSGAEAIQRIREKPHIVLLDIMMPDLHGLKVLDKIKELSPSTEVIMVTGLDEHAVGVESMKRGAFEFVTKPVDFNHLKFLLDFLAAKIEAEQST